MTQDEDSLIMSNQNGNVTNSSNNYGAIDRTINQTITPKCLTFRQKAAYGLGHIYNDLCAAMWFSYTLLFLQAVLAMEATAAGSMMLLGQVMDALATPVIGFLADRWGSKRIWHFTGTILVFCSFPLIFSRCLGCWMSSTGTYLKWWQPLYYAVVIIIFQCGWAVVQISHLAMIPALTDNLEERSELTAIRYTASVCSGVTVYMITWLVLKISDAADTSIGPTDDYKFRDVSLFLTAIGCSLTIIFHIGLYKQNKIDNANGNVSPSKSILKKSPENGVHSDVAVANGKEKKITFKENNSYINNNMNGKHVYEKKNFFLSPLLYQAALLYVASRLFSALGLVYVPLFLDERLNSTESTETVEMIASVPLASYISSFVASVLLKYRSNHLNNKQVYTIGSVLSILACSWIAISLSPTSGSFQLYAVATLLGAGSSITMVASLCITADLIGVHSNQGAVVYSVVTFADKLITGLAVIIIENYKCENTADCPQYYRNILAYVCGGSAVLGLLTILTGEIISKIRKSKV